MIRTNSKTYCDDIYPPIATINDSLCFARRYYFLRILDINCDFKRQNRDGLIIGTPTLIRLTFATFIRNKNDTTIGRITVGRETHGDYSPPILVYDMEEYRCTNLKKEKKKEDTYAT